MIARARMPIVAAVIYAGLFVVALLVSRNGACCGEQTIWASILTLPWSILSVVVLDAIDPSLTERAGMLALIPGALVNVAILYLLGRSWARRADAKDRRP